MRIFLYSILYMKKSDSPSFIVQLKKIISAFKEQGTGVGGRLNFKHYIEGRGIEGADSRKEGGSASMDAKDEREQGTQQEQDFNRITDQLADMADPTEEGVVHSTSVHTEIGGRKTELGFDKVAVAYTAQKVRVPIEAFAPKENIEEEYDPDIEREPRKIKSKIFPGGPIVTPNTEPIIIEDQDDYGDDNESIREVEAEHETDAQIPEIEIETETGIGVEVIADQKNQNQNQKQRQPDPSTVLKQPVFSRVQAFISKNTKKQSVQSEQKNTVSGAQSDNIQKSKHGDHQIKSQRIYADYASLTPIDERVKHVMIEAMDMYTANPSSLYAEGVAAAKALADARTSIAGFFGVHKQEVVFTSGGTESNNLVFSGVLDTALNNSIARPHFIVSTIEHPSIIEIALDLVTRGYEVSFIPVDEHGLVNPKDVKKALREETVLVSIMYANNEIGTVQPIKEISREVRHFKKSLGRGAGDYPYIHTDACQAVLYEDMRIPGLNIDFMSVDGGKIYGPRGAGVLIKKRTAELGQLMYGGRQESGLRPGTENLVSIIGLKHAFDIAHSERDDEIPRLRELQSTCIEMIFSKLADILPAIKINGTLDERLPNNINICFPGIDAEFLVLRLDVLGVAASSVTSCRANNEDSSSYVIEALGRPDCSQSSLRITLGRYTTAVDVALIADKVVQAVTEQVNQRGKGK